MTKPIRAVEKVALIGGAVGLAVGTAMSWPMVRSWLTQTASIVSNLGGGADGVLPANPV